MSENQLRILSTSIKKCFITTKFGTLLLNLSKPTFFDEFDKKLDFNTLLSTITGFQQFSNHSKITSLKFKKFNILITDCGNATACFITLKNCNKKEDIKRRDAIDGIFGNEDGLLKLKCIQILELFFCYYEDVLADIVEKEIILKKKKEKEFRFKFEEEKELNVFKVIQTLDIFKDFEKFIVIPIVNTPFLCETWYSKLIDISCIIKILLFDNETNEILLSHTKEDIHEFLKCSIKEKKAWNKVGKIHKKSERKLKIVNVNELFSLCKFNFGYGKVKLFNLALVLFLEEGKFEKSKFEKEFEAVRKEMKISFPSSLKEFKMMVKKFNEKKTVKSPKKEFEEENIRSPIVSVSSFVRKKKIS